MGNVNKIFIRSKFVRQRIFEFVFTKYLSFSSRIFDDVWLGIKKPGEKVKREREREIFAKLFK